MEDDRRGRPSVLIVDDDPAIRSLMKVVCRRVGYRCDDAHDGYQALEKIRSNVYDVILLDLMMPKMNGYQVIAALREIDQRPPVIVVTAQGARQIPGVLDGYIVHALVQKPFDIDTVTGVIIEVAQKMYDRRAGRSDER